jgi:hypothetical protein
MHRFVLPVAVATAFLAGALGAQATSSPSPVKAFRELCDKAMDAMMEGMAAPTTGDVDRDFVAMMVPHHQGAINMAVAELRYGKDENLKRIAQEIIVDQQQEIAAMRLALHEPLPEPAPAPTALTPHTHTPAIKESP